MPGRTITDSMHQPPSEDASGAALYRVRTAGPSPALVPYVRSYRLLTASALDAPRQGLHLWPDGGVEIGFCFGGRFDLTDGRGGYAATEHGGFVAGPKLGPDAASFGAGIDLLNVSLRPGTAGALLAGGVAEVAGRFAAPKMVLSRAATALLDRSWADLASAPPMARVVVVEQVLWRLLEDCAAPRPELRHALHLIEISGGRTSLRALEATVGVGGRTLERLFQDQVGLTPKGYARLVRFRRAFDLFATRSGHDAGGRRSPLGRVARECGYYDQAHMTNEFATLARLSPARLCRLLRDDGPGADAFFQDGLLWAP